MREREMSAEFTSKNGFSVVAPTRMTTRFSTACRSASCWLRLKRWISSTKRIVFVPADASLRSAAEISLRRSATVPPIAETSTNAERVVSAMMRAMLVLPVPAGPNRITDESASAVMARASQLPGPTASFCPRSSESERGRMRTASGATAYFARLSISVKSVSMRLPIRAGGDGCSR